jgi:E3 ubiquitin-protein ligase TRIP12
MIKARAKAERAAARHSTAAGSNTTISSAPLSTAITQDVPNIEAEAAEAQALDAEDVLPGAATKESVIDRAELLRSKSDVVGHFMQLMVPILVDVYAASVVIPIRVKCLTAMLKAVSFLNNDGIKCVLKVCIYFHYYSPFSTLTNSLFPWRVLLLRSYRQKIILRLLSVLFN